MNSSLAHIGKNELAAQTVAFEDDKNAALDSERNLILVKERNAQARTYFPVPGELS